MFELMESDTQRCWMLILTGYTVTASSRDRAWSSEMHLGGNQRQCCDRESSWTSLRQPGPGSCQGCRFVGQSPVKIKCCFSGTKTCWIPVCVCAAQRSASWRRAWSHLRIERKQIKPFVITRLHFLNSIMLFLMQGSAAALTHFEMRYSQLSI